jgi:hypothetical protein
MHINMIRDQGLGLLTPLVEGEAAERAEAALATLYPEPRARLATGRTPEPAARSLPGHAQPTEAEPDPLAVIETQRLLKKLARRSNGAAREES